MIDSQNSLLEIRKYLKRLKTVVERQASFYFFGSKIIDKIKIDDVLCCIEASLPDDYKSTARKYGLSKFKGYSTLVKLNTALHKKFLFFDSYCSIKQDEVFQLIDNLPRALDSDFKTMYNNGFDMF